VLKPNMVIAGKKSATTSSAEEVAEKTAKCLKDCVPATVAGIAFLSGGQADEEATIHLNLINQLGPHPWPVTFSYGRALQHLPQKAWAGKTENVAAAQRAFSHRSRMNGLAAQGTWKPELEKVGMAA
jgi:fructose-bisphosphate aldolase, class I